MKTLLALILSCVACVAQNVAALTHGSSNTEEFKAGCPTNWPSSVVDIGASTNLPPTLNATNGWVVWTKTQLETTKSELSALKEAFNVQWIAKNGPGKTWTAKEFNDYIDELAPGAWDALDDVIANTGIPAEVRSALKKARRKLLTAQQVEQKNAETIQFVNYAAMFGILTSEQSDTILGTTH